MSSQHSKLLKVLIVVIAVLLVGLGLEALSLANMKVRLDTLSSDSSQPSAETAQADNGDTEPPKANSPAPVEVAPAPWMSNPWPMMGPAQGTWDPFEQMRRMRAEMDQLMMTMQPLSPTSMAPMQGAQPFELSIDVDTYPDRYVVHIQGRDVGQEGVNVAMQGNVLTVSGTRQSESQAYGDQGQVVQRQEVAQSFHRAITLPRPIQADAMTQRMVDGELEVTVPRGPEGDAI